VERDSGKPEVDGEEGGMWARPWPNGMGWDVGETAEVWKLENGLGVRLVTSEGKIKTLFIPDPNLDPVRAVRRCLREGKVEEE
jgi:hypothetical protein